MNAHTMFFFTTADELFLADFLSRDLDIGDMIEAQTPFQVNIGWNKQWNASGAYLRVFEHTTFFTGAPVSRILGPPFRGNWGPRLWNEGQSMSLKWQSSNESESGICMIICRICCDICCARGPYQGPRGPYQGPPQTVPGPPRTSIPPHSRTSVQRPSRAFGPRGFFPFFLFLPEGAPPGHVAASHTAFAVFAVWAVRPWNALRHILVKGLRQQTFFVPTYIQAKSYFFLFTYLNEIRMQKPFQFNKASVSWLKWLTVLETISKYHCSLSTVFFTNR